MKIFLLILALALLSGCGSYSSNMRIGTDQSYMSLSDQREASQSIRVESELPKGAVTLGLVDASRCHRNSSDLPPDENIVLLDLKAAAFARGAEGIAGVKIEKDSGLHRNCWFVLTGKATMFRYKEK
jgi:hypothetical protein